MTKSVSVIINQLEGKALWMQAGVHQDGVFHSQWVHVGKQDADSFKRWLDLLEFIQRPRKGARCTSLRYLKRPL